jgi:hypothetical protein
MALEFFTDVTLAPWQRDRFLQAVARRLTGQEIGDGSVHAAAVAAQREVITGSRRAIRRH